jgi:hypothetical protein
VDKFFTANSPLACGVFRLSVMTAFRPPTEYLIIDSTVVRAAHQHASGAKGGLKIRPSDAREAA